MAAPPRRNTRITTRDTWPVISSIREIFKNIFSSKKAARGGKKPFDDNYAGGRKTATNLARKRLERAYGMKGQSNFNAEELDELRQIFEFYDIDSSKTMDMR